LKRSEYHQLAEQGAFRDERVELIFGMVVTMSPIDQAHAESTRKIVEILMAALRKRANVYCQSPFAASDESEPEPDIYVTDPGDRWDEHPTSAFLVVEVSRSSLAYDRNEKRFLYGISEVDEYWIVDHVHGVVEVCRNRVAGTWQSVETFRRGDTIAMQAFPDVQIHLHEILPPES
jgi:Uma2 family endonuclease